MYEIKTQGYLKKRTVLLDDMTVTVHPPGAGSELAFNQTQRRLDFLDKKIKAGTESEADLDLYETLEARTLAYFASILHDDTPDNRGIKEWLDKTPMPVILQAIDDMKRQFEETDRKEGDAGNPTVEAEVS